MSYRVINGTLYQVGNIGSVHNERKEVRQAHSNKSFNEILNNTIEQKQGYTVSKHAADRLKEVNFTSKDMEAIEKGFKIAQGKGSKNSLMLYKDVALIASIENKTLITAIEKKRAKDNVFTNIDSVVIL